MQHRTHPGRVARVVYGVRDPHPRAAGGAETLRAAGVDVEGGVRQSEVEAGNIAWLTAVRRGRPYLIWKYAATLDGRSAALDGSSMWITSEAARMDVHAYRSTVDAVIVGVGTVLADNPQLTARNLRDGSLAIRQPLRVVVDSAGRTPPDARVRDGAAPTWIATAADFGGSRTTRWTCVSFWSAFTNGMFGRRCWRAARGWREPSSPPVLVDKVIGYLAPKMLGAGPTALIDTGVTTIADAIELELVDVTRIGPDLRFTAIPRRVED